jgi:hypothetical protein
LFDELVLVDQSYHEFASPHSVFARLEEAGGLAHRVGEAIEPGSEELPFVPEVATRAHARARFLREHGGRRELEMDWSRVVDRRTGQQRTLFDPFASDYADWQRAPDGC